MKKILLIALFSFAITSIYAETYVSSDVPLSISDHNTTSSTLVISNEMNIGDLNLNIQVNHTYTGDLEITLYAPTGESVLLIADVCDSDENFNVTFDDEASAFFSSSCADNLTGIYKADGNLSAFNGLSLDGVWTLEIYDDASGDSGSLVAWSIEATTAEPVPFSIYSIIALFALLGGISILKLRRRVYTAS